MQLIDKNIEFEIDERENGEHGRRRMGTVCHGNLELLIWVEVDTYPANHPKNGYLNYSATFSISDVRMHRLAKYDYGFDNINDGLIRWDYSHDIHKDKIEGWEYEELWLQIKRRGVTTANRMIACIGGLPPIDVEPFMMEQLYKGDDNQHREGR